MTDTFVGVAGLPRAGATLLCRMLAMHPEIHCEDESTPLCRLLLDGRRKPGGDPRILASLDRGLDAAYGHLESAMEDFMCSWHHAAGDKKAVVDKNLAWLQCLELLLFLVPDAKLIVCLRELGQIYGSIEAQQRELAPQDGVNDRADDHRLNGTDRFFPNDKMIGTPLVAVHSVAELPKAVQDRIYFLRFEDLVEKPSVCMSHLFTWMGLSPFKVDTERLAAWPQETDSRYDMKFLHQQSDRLVKPDAHAIPPRIQAQIENATGGTTSVTTQRPGSEMERASVVWHDGHVSGDYLGGCR